MVNYYKDKVCLNVLAGSKENAKDIYQAAGKCVLVGVLSIDYPGVKSAVNDMKDYMDILEGNLSVGLGAGNPKQCLVVGDIAKEIKANHFNQVFTSVAYTRANVNNNTSLINCLVSPTGRPGYVKISTGPLSSTATEAAIVPVDVAAKMCIDMGGTSLKFFPMKGLSCKEELIEVAKACALNDLILEPTGGIDIDNFKEIVELSLKHGVKKVIPHVYSSIIDKETGNTRIEDVKVLMKLVKEILD
ncbi:2-dehydro-3-deoxy-phosphogluconate aldolase [Anaerorhabdus sp.]|uniref:2-dehydro-3-deoxy-phosphogluconate aldolase n=1 Tax=Anaerorhabdus sp. TaxID=1872524 RepID=UPI002FC92E94